MYPAQPRPQPSSLRTRAGLSVFAALVKLTRSRHQGAGGSNMPRNHEIDEIDVEIIWERICEIAAGRAGISSECAEAILEKNGFYAYGHTGLEEAVEVVSWGVRRLG